MPRKQSKNKTRQNNQRKSKGRKTFSRRGNSKNKKNRTKLSYRKRGGSEVELDKKKKKTLLAWNNVFTGNNGKIEEGKNKKAWINSFILQPKFLTDARLEILLNYLKEQDRDVSPLEIIANMDSIKYFIDEFKSEYEREGGEYITFKEVTLTELPGLISQIERQVISHEQRASEAKAKALDQEARLSDKNRSQKTHYGPEWYPYK
jgi:hypothetical protein